MNTLELIEELRQEWATLDLDCTCIAEVKQFGDTSCPVCKIDYLLSIAEEVIE